MTTLGTGIGTAIVYRGVLIPNSELGHIEVDGHDAETAPRQHQGEGGPFLQGVGQAICSAITSGSRRSCGRT